MIQKKICMLGSFSVGKTSLVKRYVSSVFSDKYQTTVGVRIDKKQIDVDGEPAMLMLWDLAGEDQFSSIRPAHLRGMSGYMLVIDGTRKQSYEVAMTVYQSIREQYGDLPMVFALNKADLKHEWELDEAMIDRLKATGSAVLESSAKLDNNVEALFSALGQQLFVKQPGKEGI